MRKKIRMYWPGRLHPGDIVECKGFRCQVCGDYHDSKVRINVPKGCVPVFYLDSNSPVYLVPFDDLDVIERKE